jgi:hypothetical protein
VLPVSLPAIPVLDVETVLARLPAEARARVAWAKKPIENGLGRLRTEPLSDELVAAVIDETLKPLLLLGRAFWAIVGTNQDEWRARFVGDFKLEEQKLAAFVEEDDSRDTVGWIFGLLQSFLGLALSVPADFISQIDESILAQLGSDDDFKTYLRGSVVLMAAAETRKAGGDPQRARDLVDVAFLEMNKFRATMRKHGVSVTPFPSETLIDRRRRLLLGAKGLRNALSERDWRVMEEARFRALR